MFYRKNVRTKEAVARIVTGIVMLLCGIFGLKASSLGIVLAVAGGVSILTGLFGYCPMCAIAGRKTMSDQ